MLILTRRIGESVRIGEDVTVMIVKNQDGQVRLGFQAPSHVRILRAELETIPRQPIGKQA